jgi:GTPase
LGIRAKHAEPADRESTFWVDDNDQTDEVNPTHGEMELADRQALRRVAGLSTELADVSEAEIRQLRLERVVLVGVWTDGTAVEAENSLAELAALAQTAGSTILEGLVQRRSRPDPGTYIGRGKLGELRDVVVATGADTVICDGELSPGQLRNLEQETKVKVIDRTALILDIFAQHARSRDGKAQVELAQLSYLLPRLRGWGEALSRQVGGRAAGGVGIGGRGPGETKIELDRRRIRNRMAKLRREISGMKQVRETQRGVRRRSPPYCAITPGQTIPAKWEGRKIPVTAPALTSTAMRAPGGRVPPDLARLHSARCDVPMACPGSASWNALRNPHEP